MAVIMGDSMSFHLSPSMRTISRTLVVAYRLIITMGIDTRPLRYENMYKAKGMKIKGTE